MRRPPLLAALVAVPVGLALLAAGCTGSGTADPGLDGTPTVPTSGPSATGLADFDGADAVDRYVAWRERVHGLPPTPAGDLDAEALVEGVAAPGSPAAEWIADQVARAAEFGVIARGDVVAEVEQAPTATGDDRSAVLCVSIAAAPTDVETGEEASTDQPAPPTSYQRAEVTYREGDAGWLVVSEAALDPPACVPDSAAGAIEQQWQAYVAAIEDWGRRGSPGDDLGALAELTTGPARSDLEASPGGRVLEMDASAVLHGHELLSADRGQVRSQWCFDYGRDPDASATNSTSGESQPLDQPPAIQDGTWVLVDGQWRLESIEATLPTSPDAPETLRCFDG